jgi:hypothetical protein
VKNLGTITSDKDVPTKKFVEDNAGGGGSSGVFYAEYGVTTYADIAAAYAADKFIIVKRSLNGTTMYLFNDVDSSGTFYFRSFSNSAYTNYGCYINSSGTWAVNSYTYAPTNSPAFTGTPSAPTPNEGDDSTKLATTEFVMDVVGDIAAALEGML